MHRGGWGRGWAQAVRQHRMARWPADAPDWYHRGIAATKPICRNYTPSRLCPSHRVDRDLVDRCLGACASAQIESAATEIEVLVLARLLRGVEDVRVQPVDDESPLPLIEYQPGLSQNAQVV